MADVTVLMILRGVNAARLSWHGSPWVVAPSLDRFAAQATVLDRHYSPVIDKDSAVSMLLPTSLIQSLHDRGHSLFWIASHKQIVPELFKKISIDSVDEKVWSQAFAEVQLRSRGKNALIVVDLPFAEPPWTLRVREKDLYFPAATPEPTASEPESEGWDEFEEPLEKVDEGTFSGSTDDFVDALPWEAEIPESVGSEDDLTHLRLIETQAAAIGHVDAVAGAIFEQILANVAVMVVGDRGLELGDHGTTGDFNPQPWISRVNVPCIWYNPTGDGVPRRVLTPSSHHDVAVTLAKRCLVELPDFDFAMDLTDLSLEDASGNINRAIVSIGGDGFRAIRTSEWSLMVADSGKTSLYSLPDDPWEVLDLASQREDEVAELLLKLEKNQSSHS